MISAMSLNDRFSGPSSGTSPTPLQLASRSRRGRGGDVAGGDGRHLADARNRPEEESQVPDRRGLTGRVIHERWVGKRVVRDDASHAEPPEGLGSGPREADEGSVNRRGSRVRQCQPEHRIGAGERLVHDCRVSVRALDDVDALANVGRELCRVVW